MFTPNSIPLAPGCYILIIRVEKDVNIKVGSLGYVPLRKGLYVYCGSARGKGALCLRHRILRHLKRRKKVRWHIDYILSNDNVKIVGIVYTITRVNMECTFATKLLETGKFLIVKRRLGSTDCKCPSHFLGYLGDSIRDLVNLITSIFDEKIKLIMLEA